jgi:hypothetical protein
MFHVSDAPGRVDIRGGGCESDRWERRERSLGAYRSLPWLCGGECMCRALSTRVLGSIKQADTRTCLEYTSRPESRPPHDPRSFVHF